MSGVLCAQTGGYPNFTGSATVTVGYATLGTYPNSIDFWGYVGIGGTPGAISPSTWASSGLTIVDLDYRYVYSNNTQRVVFIVSGYAPNGGWTTFTIDGFGYDRSTAIYSYNGTESAWSWDATPTGNPFGVTVGATKAVSWS